MYAFVIKKDNERLIGAYQILFAYSIVVSVSSFRILPCILMGLEKYARNFGR